MENLNSASKKFSYDIAASPELGRSNPFEGTDYLIGRQIDTILNSGQILGRDIKIDTMANSRYLDEKEVYLRTRIFQKNINIGLMLWHYENRSNSIFIDSRDIYSQREGIGLNLQVALEDLCNRANIKLIENVVKSSRKYRMIGAYVWTRFGYEFADSQEASNAKKDFLASLKPFFRKQDFSQRIKPRIKKAIKKPSSFLKVKLRNTKTGEIRDIGKEILLGEHSPITWHGKRVLDHSSESSKRFVRYLEEKGRHDLIEKYYSDVDTSDLAQEPDIILEYAPNKKQKLLAANNLG